MPKRRITTTLLTGLPPLPPGAAKERWYDTGTTGFIAEQTSSGVTFYFRYFDERQRSHEIHLGCLGDVTVKQARDRAKELRALVALGGDPAAETRRRLAIPLLRDFVADRYLPHVAEHLRSAHNIEAYLRRRILPALGRLALNEVTVTDVAALRRRLIDAGLSNASVNRHLATLRAIFNLARKWRVYEGPNPAASPGMLREVHRDKYLTAEQTRALIRALDLEPNRDAAAALALLVFTGARKGEVLGARWEFVDLDRRLLTVPRSKHGRPRHIALSEPAVRVLAVQARRRRPDNPHVFPGKTPGAPLEDVRRAWERAKTAAGLPADLRIHDLRHSFASTLVNLGVPLHEVGVLLGHLDPQVTARYAHHAPQRLIDTAARAAKAWDLLPPPDGEESGDA